LTKAVILDLGGVIVAFDFKRAYARLEGMCDCPAAEIPQRLRSTDLVPRFERGLIEPQAFVEQLCSLLTLRATYEQFCGLWTSVFFPEPLIPESLLEPIREHHRLVLLSNTNRIHFEMIDRTFPLLRHFDARVLSYQVGATKPSPEIYREAIKQAQCRAEECFFADDIPLFVEGAVREGIDAVRFESAEQLERELSRRQVI